MNQSVVDVVGVPPPGMGQDALLHAASMLAQHFGGYTFAPHAARITRQSDGAEFTYRVTGLGRKVVFDVYSKEPKS